MFVVNTKLANHQSGKGFNLLNEPLKGYKMNIFCSKSILLPCFRPSIMWNHKMRQISAPFIEPIESERFAGVATKVIEFLQS